MKKMLFLIILLSSNYVFAYDWQNVVGKVVLLEPTYPDHLNIKIDADAGACSAGTWLFFYGGGLDAQEKKNSVKAVYSGLLASMYAGKQVAFFGVDQGCVIYQVHLLPN